MKNRAVGWIKDFLKYGIGFGLLAYVLVQNWAPKGNNPGLQGLFQQTPDGFAFAGLALVGVLCVMIQFLRWYLLVRALDLPFTYGTASRLGLVGSFWNAFTPGSVGGDLVKAYYIARGQPGRRASAVATVIADRLVGLFGLIWFSAVFGSAFWLAGEAWIEKNDYIKDIIRVCGVLTISTVVGWMILGLIPTPERLGDRLSRSLTGFSKKIGDTLAEVWYVVCTYRQRPRAVYITIGLTAIIHIGFVIMFYLAVRVFPAKEPATFAETLVLAPIGYIAQAFFPAPGGVGGGEYIFGYLYTLLGRPESTGVIGRLTLRVYEWSVGIVGLFVYLRMKDELKVVEEELERSEQTPAPGSPSPPVPLSPSERGTGV